MPHHSPPIIGLAGGIGSGKSAVRLLASLGCVVSDSDRAGREALRDPVVRDTLVEWWGADILDGDGEIDRGRIASIVFADSSQRKRLESLTHPWIRQRRDEQFRDAPVGVPALVIDAPLLFEVGLDKECDAVVFVDAARQTRLNRVKATRDWDDAEIQRREDSQLPLDVKRNRADYVLQNDGDLSELSAQIHTILSEIVAPGRT